MKNYVALLRGINLGSRRLKMDELRQAFANIGIQDAQTILASGNVVFSSPENNLSDLKEKLQSGLEQELNYPVFVILRTQSQIETLLSANPIQDFDISKDTKFHISFLEESLDSKLELPHISKDPNFEVHRIDDLHLLDILRLGPSTGTLDLMDWLGRNFADGATTRTWNTILKIQSKLESL